jgi:hypothetical protein
MHSTTHFIGRVGVARVGLAAMNLALWDIQLRLEEQPLWRHLGPCKTKVKAYNTDGGWLTWSTEELISDMHRIIDRGFDAVKMKLGRPDPREDFKRVKAVRKAIGDKIKLMVDVNTVWDLKTAIVWGRRLEQFDIAWLEELMYPFDVRAHTELAKALDRSCFRSGARPSGRRPATPPRRTTAPPPGPCARHTASRASAADGVVHGRGSFLPDCPNRGRRAPARAVPGAWPWRHPSATVEWGEVDRPP